MPYIKPEVFNYDIHKIPQQVPIFNHINLTHIVALYFLKINFIVILPSNKTALPSVLYPADFLATSLYKFVFLITVPTFVAANLFSFLYLLTRQQYSLDVFTNDDRFYKLW